MLKAAGVSKVTFVGGEPFMHPHLDELIMAAKHAGLVTSVVTNGSLLDAQRLLKLRGAFVGGGGGRALLGPHHWPIMDQ